jgi:hypothetical protein
MMAKRPEDRPQTMSEVIGMLESSRATPREAGDVSADLKTFARTAGRLLTRPPTPPPPVEPATNPPPVLPGKPLVTIDFDDVAPWPSSGGSGGGGRPLAWRDVIGGMLAAGVLLLIGLAAWAWFHAELRPQAATTVASTTSPPNRLPPRPSTIPLGPTPAPAPVAGPEPPEPPASVPEMPAPTPMPQPSEPSEPSSPVLVANDFAEARALWPAPEPGAVAAEPNQDWGYTADGALFYGIKTDDSLHYSWNWSVPPVGEPFELRARVRIVAGTPGARGVVTLHFFTDVERRSRAEDPKAFVIRMGTDGLLEVGSSFWTAEKHPDFLATRPIPHAAIRGEGQWNDLVVRVRHREVEVLVNGEPVTDTLASATELLPVGVQFGVESYPGPVRAEMESFSVVRLEGPAAREVGAKVAGRLIQYDNFTNPDSGWGEQDEPGPYPNHRGYEAGHYVLDVNRQWSGCQCWNAAPADVAEPYEFRLVGRIRGEGASSGGWGAIITTPGKGRGIQVAIDRAGRLVVDPAWQGAGAYPRDRRPFDPVALGDEFRAAEWAVLTVRVERRRVTFRVNGQTAGRPVEVGYDLLPSMPQIAVFKPDLGTHVRAEFEDVAVRAVDR